MKKTMLWGALCMIISSQLSAEPVNQTNAAQPASKPNAASNPTTPPTSATSTPAAEKNATTTPEAKPVIINCDYKIPAETKQVEQDLVIAWGEKAIIQAFDFDSTTIDGQMQKLQSCFTDQGWQGFNNALQKSGNIEAIKTQKLTVSSQLDGKVEVLEAKDNQWKIAVPLQVVYQNDKEKVTQLLHLNVTIGRKVSGDLGIMQMVATPRTEATNNPSQPAASTPVQPNTASIPVQPGTGTLPNQATPPASPQQPGQLNQPSQPGSVNQPALPANPSQPKPATNGSNPPNTENTH